MSCSSTAPLISSEVRQRLEQERKKIGKVKGWPKPKYLIQNGITRYVFLNQTDFSDCLKQKYPDGIHNYETTYRHDFFGKLGENREASFQYQSTRSLTPDINFKSSTPTPTPTPNWNYKSEKLRWIEIKM